MVSNYYWPNKKILIVEDELVNAQLLQILLEPTKVQMSHVFTGDDAVRYITNNPDTDLILMDINLPEKDGLMTTLEVKKINKDIIVIAQSAYVGVIKQSHIDRVGADDFIPKPIDHDLLLSKIDHFFKDE